MTNDELDRLSKLSSMLELCAKMGGTPMFVRVQRLVSEDIKELVDKLDPPEPVKKPVVVQPVARPLEPAVIDNDDMASNDHIDRRV